MNDHPTTSDRGQAQGPNATDDVRSSREAQRLPRMRRCPCCLCSRRLDFERHGYKVIDGCQVWGTDPRGFGLDAAKRLLKLIQLQNPGAELERVSILSTGGTQYELVRGGRWVDWWQGLFGCHAHESREWRRKP